MSFHRAWMVAALCFAPFRLSGQSGEVADTVRPPAIPPIRLWHVGVALGGAALISTLDDDLQRWTVEHRGTTAQDVAKVWELWGDGRGAPIITLGTLATGVALRKPEVTRLGGRLATSFIVAAAIGRGAKRAIGRARPSEGDGQYDFDPWTDQSAFPSGHTTNAFLLSTTFADAIGDRRVDVVLYTLAAGTGVSRVINNRHWLSDVVGGALLGTTVAKVVDGKWRIFGLESPTFLTGNGTTGLRWTADLPALRGARMGQD
jgi:membrane-associated phospholipid phosphatase